MSTKSKVLTFLNDKIGKTISGEEIAIKLNVSRTSIWKAIQQLKEEGYSITAITKGGYCLTETPDILNADVIDNLLQKIGIISKNVDIEKIYVYKEIDSTNTEAKRLALTMDAEKLNGTMVIADTQTSGRGRLGRNFYSPNKHGLYISFLLKTNQKMIDTQLITVATGVAVCRTLEKLCLETNKETKKFEIKWVNDVYSDGRKICGILTEGITNLEAGTIDSVVLGIGINLWEKETDFPEEIRKIAGSVLGEQGQKASFTRNKLIVELIKQLDIVLDTTNYIETINEYRNRSFIIGKIVDVIKPTGTYQAKVLEITDKAHLIIAKIDSNGKEIKEELFSGEVSLRIQKQ